MCTKMGGPLKYSLYLINVTYGWGFIIEKHLTFL